MVKKKSITKERKSAMVKILVFITLIALIGLIYYLYEPTDYTYNSYDFEQRGDGFWSVELMTVLGEDRLMFYHHPSELEHYDYNINITNQFTTVRNNQGVVRIGIGEELMDRGTVAIAGVEISKVTGRVIGLETKSGSIQEQPAIPQFNCENASEQSFIVQFKKGDVDSIELEEDYCLTLTVIEPETLIELADLFVYNIIGVMK